jgi:uncharacterized membrane protein
MKHYETSIDIDAAPAEVWAVMRDVERWPEWTASVTSVRLRNGGPLGFGHRAVIRQPRLPPAFWRVTELDEGRGFTWVSGVPGMRVVARHRVEPSATGARATLSIRYDGLLGAVLARMTDKLNRSYLQMEAEGLKRRSEGG